MIEVVHEDESLDRLEIDPGFTGGYALPIVRAYRRRMQQIRAAHDERDFYANKGMHFEKLEGKRKGQYSIRLNDQYRLILTLDGKSPKIVRVKEITDYH